MLNDDVEFLLIVERGPLEAQAILLSESIRKFGGRYRDAAITAVSPRPDWRPADAVRRRLAELGAEYRAADLISGTPEYGTSYRVLAAGMLAREQGACVLVQLDSDTVFVGEPSLQLGEDLLLARPVDEVGMCSTGPSDPRDALWQAMCRCNGTDVDALGWVETSVGGTQVRSCYNGGFVAGRRELFVETEAVFERIVASGLRSWPKAEHGVRIGAGAVGARGYAWWGTGQAAIAIAAARLGGGRRILDSGHNVPLHLLDRIEKPARSTHLHYHWLFEKTEEAQQAVEAALAPGDEAVAWLRERLPLPARTVEGVGVFSPRLPARASTEQPRPGPAVAVVMTSYRDTKYLREAVESVLAQDFSDFEFMIVDDGSPDPEPVAALAALDPRIRTLRLERNCGTAEAANRGIAATSGRIIARIDSDDVAEPAWLGRLVTALRADPDLGLIGTAVTRIDEDGQPTGVQRMPESDFEIRFTMLFHNPFYHSTTAFRRELFDAAGGYRSDHPVSQDHFLWFAMLPLCRARNVAEPLVRYRINPAGLTISNGGHSPRARTASIRNALWREIGIAPPLARLTVAAEADNLLRGRRAGDAPAHREACELVESALRRVDAIAGDFIRLGDEDAATHFATALRRRAAAGGGSERSPLLRAARRAGMSRMISGGASMLRRARRLLDRPPPLGPTDAQEPSKAIMAAIHPVSPYCGFDPAPFQEDLQGWGSDDPIFRMLIAELRPRLIVEVGSWKGASAIHMAGLCREFGLETTLICIDTWLGSSEHLLGRPEWRASLRPRHGYPQLYYTFLANVIRSGHSKVIVPLPNTSDHSAIVLREKDIRPDLIYIDASHDEGAVYRDLAAYWPLLRPGGVLIGDDFAKFPGVRRAAMRFSHEISETLEDFGDKFVLRSPAEAGAPNGRNA